MSLSQSSHSESPEWNPPLGGSPCRWNSKWTYAASCHRRRLSKWCNFLLSRARWRRRWRKTSGIWSQGCPPSWRCWRVSIRRDGWRFCEWAYVLIVISIEKVYLLHIVIRCWVAAWWFLLLCFIPDIHTCQHITSIVEASPSSLVQSNQARFLLIFPDARRPVFTARNESAVQGVQI